MINLSLITILTYLDPSLANGYRSLEHICAQSLASEIHLVIITSGRQQLEYNLPNCLQKVHSYEVVQPPKHIVHSIDECLIYLSRKVVRTKLVAYVEDHAFITENWVEAMLTAFELDDWAAVSSTYKNANPDTWLSWANLMLTYGGFLDPFPEGESIEVGAHNMVLNREYFLDAVDKGLNYEYGIQLGQRLKLFGYRSYISNQTWVYHTQASKWRDAIRARYLDGRIRGANRADYDSWSTARSYFYLLVSPLFIIWRFLILWNDKMSKPEFFARRFEIIAPFLILSMIHSIGMIIGFVAGVGDALIHIQSYEGNRLQQVNESDFQYLSQDIQVIGEID